MKKILLIEDDPLLSRMYSRLFTIHEYEFLEDLDPQSGLARAKTEKPDLILLDIMMPIMNGLEVLEALKKDPETQNIPVIMITTVEDDETEKRSKELVAAGYLVKSRYDPDETVKYVAKVLKGTTKN